MLTSISPLGERTRGNRWWLTVWWLSLGAVLGGAAIGAALGALGQALAGSLGDVARLVLLAGACALAAAWDMSSRRLPGRRQVNEDWLVAYRSWVYGTGFGLQLGAVHAGRTPGGGHVRGPGDRRGVRRGPGRDHGSEQPGAHARRPATTSPPSRLSRRPGPPSWRWRCGRARLRGRSELAGSVTRWSGRSDTVPFASAG